MMHRPSPRMEGVDVKLASKCRRPDGSVWLNQYRVCEKLASSERYTPLLYCRLPQRGSDVRYSETHNLKLPRQPLRGSRDIFSCR
uniref:Uncharacterized protein n=1 Tax=Eimeria tenella TaxID=5802 RepID=H9B9W8_EIMTE|nr:hypothetical protein [Eimeria tenella]